MVHSRFPRTSRLFNVNGAVDDALVAHWLLVANITFFFLIYIVTVIIIIAFMSNFRTISKITIYFQ